MTRELPFVTLDVFAKEAFKGNPLAVVTIPRSTDPKPTQQQKQTIAREFNLSETVFVHDDSDQPDRRTIDIFLPTQEIPFAGHPTIGTAVSLLSQGVTTLVTKAGPIPLVQPTPGTVQAAIPHKTHLHAARLSSVADSFPPTALSPVQAIKDAELASPLFSIVDGMTFVLVELPSLDLLSRVTLTAADLPQETLLDAGSKHGFLGRYYYVKLSEEPGKVAIRSRMMEGSFEDPATGSAACCLCSYLSRTAGGPDGTTRYEVTQGVEMGRESHIIVEVGTKAGAIDTVSLAGTAMQIMRGHVAY